MQTSYEKILNLTCALIIDLNNSYRFKRLIYGKIYKYIPLTASRQNEILFCKILKSDIKVYRYSMLKKLLKF